MCIARAKRPQSQVHVELTERAIESGSRLDQMMMMSACALGGSGCAQTVTGFLVKPPS